MHKNKRGVLSFLIIVLLFLPSAWAYSWIVSNPSPPSSKPYDGDVINLNSRVTASSDNVCDIKCTWKTDNYGPENIGNPEVLIKNAYKDFGFKILIKGTNGLTSDTLIVECTKNNAWCLGSPETITQIPISFSFNYKGDGACTTSENHENCQSAETDCPCSLNKKCMFDANRQKDSLGCTTYCGNNICEKNEVESCSSCPIDCKKCDLSTCSIGSECEGGYCVWGVCWKSSTRIGDTHCDSDKGENCANSPSDCTCQAGQRCSTTTNQCEFYCGNNICEESEKGICKADCKWCGDDSCDANQKETCKTCESDCGVCESEKINQEIQNQTQEVVKQGLESVSKKQKIITYSGLGAIFLVIIGYVIFKVVKSKKTKKIEHSLVKEKDKEEVKEVPVSKEDKKSEDVDKEKEKENKKLKTKSSKKNKK